MRGPLQTPAKIHLYTSPSRALSSRYAERTLLLTEHGQVRMCTFAEGCTSPFHLR